MSEILEQIDHPFWGTVQRRSGYEGWDLEQAESLPNGTTTMLRFGFDDPSDPTVQENYSAIRTCWSEIWPRILNRIAQMKSAYGYGDTPLNPAFDWFSISVPTDPLATGAEWSVMLQAAEAGWLIDFEGWEDSGGQGVF
ncbi:hypothetical protein [Rhodopirellula halodulae]|uniref:hypothetical protein n=1 Tax=Rhodopirellula halodulae TaxID=2894198 RepID=UPI001E4ECF35|nr:hypothetical protein [Rhodopirellula sp. JC737]MCC9656718.1 hypothetical protein [Rhodopirellula sp. JC737]